MNLNLTNISLPPVAGLPLPGPIRNGPPWVRMNITNINLPPALNRVDRTYLAERLSTIGVNVTWISGEEAPTPKIAWIVRNCSLAPNETWREGGDWLFKTPTLICGCGEWDNNPQSLFSRVFLFMLYAISGSMSFVLCHPRFGGGDVGMGAMSHSSGETSDSEGDETSSDSDDETIVASSRSLSRPKARLWYVDFARFCCVACVVAEHSGGENYTANNVLLVQQWVLPYLYAASGMSFMLSSNSLIAYLARLAMVFCVGVGFNWFADFAIGREWLTDFGNTIFQMAYVVVLMGLAVCTEPLRKAFRWRQRHSFRAKLPMCLKLSLFFFYVPLAIGGFAWYLTGDTTMKSIAWLTGVQGTGMQVMQDLPLLLAECGGLGVICSMCVAVGSSGWIFWILLVVVMAQQTWIPYRRGGHPFDGDIYLLGMIVYIWPMKGKELIAQLIRDYWPVGLMFGMLLAMPHVEGRCDLDPLNTWWERMRFRGLEAALLVLFLSGAISVNDPCRIMSWLNMWALYAYCSHVAWARLLPVPWGAVFTYVQIVPFLVLAYYDAQKQRKVKRENGELLCHEDHEEIGSQDEGPHRS